MQTFNAVVVAWLLVAVATFVVLLRVRAPYGRHVRPGWGPGIDHRMGWFLMELPALTVFAYFVLSGSNALELPLVILFFCWQIHYVNRTIIFPVRMGARDRQMPLLIVAMAVLFNTMNGWLNGSYLGSLGPVYPPSWLFDWRFLVGAALFLAGLTVNIQSDNHLLKLRKSGEYRIPYGGLFRWVSCPNYLGEIVEWFGFAMMSWSPAAAAFAVWTAANLVPRALANHRWYRERFDDYPEERTALVPHFI